MVWHHNGRKSEFTGVNDNADVYDLEEKSGTLTLVEYRLDRSQWAHSRYSEFKRRMIELDDHRGAKFQVVILQFV